MKRHADELDLSRAARGSARGGSVGAIIAVVTVVALAVAALLLLPTFRRPVKTHRMAVAGRAYGHGMPCPYEPGWTPFARGADAVLTEAGRRAAEGILA